MHGLILYGPPASGKDTITATLHDLDERYVLFPRLKVGPGRTTGYRMTSVHAVSRLAASGDVVWANTRYGATYVIDRDALRAQLEVNVPVLHVGQPEAIDAIRSATEPASWAVVALWCPRDVSHRRLIERSSLDVDERLAAWDETPRLLTADLTIDTARVDISQAALLIHRLNIGLD